MVIGFIGIGAMGAPMAKNLISSGHKLIVSNRSQKLFEEFAALGAKTTTDIKQAAEGDAVFLCLTDSKAVESICYGDDGLLAAMKKDQILVDLGTSRYDSTIRLSEACKKKKIKFVDAPITGLPQRAQDASLTIMCGCEAFVFEEIEPVLKCMGSKVLRMGDAGSGQLTKLINQMLYNTNMAALAEIIPMAVKLGLDAGLVEQVVNSGTGRSHASEFFLPRILSDDFEGGLDMATAYKDMISAVNLAADNKIPLPVFSAANATYQRALQEGFGKYGKGAMIRVFENILNISFRNSK